MVHTMYRCLFLNLRKLFEQKQSPETKKPSHSTADHPETCKTASTKINKIELKKKISTDMWRWRDDAILFFPRPLSLLVYYIFLRILHFGVSCRSFSVMFYSDERFIFSISVREFHTHTYISIRVQINSRAFSFRKASTRVRAFSLPTMVSGKRTKALNTTYNNGNPVVVLAVVVVVVRLPEHAMLRFVPWAFDASCELSPGSDLGGHDPFSLHGRC